jgi:putative inorganic carbon (hco3(-)) transporter
MSQGTLREGASFIDKKSGLTVLREWFGRQIWAQKLQNPLGALVLLLLAMPLSYVMSGLEFKFSALLFLGLVGVPLIGLCLFDLTLGLGMILTIALLVPFAAKFTTAPIGTLLDLLIFICMASILMRQIKERDWRFFKGPISAIVLIWLYYNILQVLNPGAESRMAWLYTVRTVAVQLLIYYIAAYAFDSKKKIWGVLKYIGFLGGISAIYGLKQQFLGLSEREKQWIYESKERFELYYNWGRLRVPSFMFDPTTFGIMMACFGIFCYVLVMKSPANRWQKAGLFILGSLALWAMAFTGTRTAYVLVPLGIFFYSGLNLSKSTLIGLGIFTVLGAGLMLKSTGNGTIYRIQSAFKPKDDASMQTRLKNQKFIQPWILAHPIGGGLGSCGEWGKRFNPDSMLAQFPHDSSYVRMAVELGWIGLLLYVLFHFIVLRTGIYYYVRVEDPWIKAVYAAILCWMFMLTCACYTQEAILQLPMNQVYNTFLAVLFTLKNFDPAFSETNVKTVN